VRRALERLEGEETQALPSAHQREPLSHP
jgi:hypothetical protein